MIPPLNFFFILFKGVVKQKMYIFVRLKCLRINPVKFNTSTSLVIVQIFSFYNCILFVDNIIIICFAFCYYYLKTIGEALKAKKTY